MFTRMTWLFLRVTVFQIIKAPSYYYKLFEWYTASSIRMGSPYHSDSMRRARDVCKGICNRKILNFLYYCKYGILVFGDDLTGPVDESKRTKRVQGWSRQIMEGGFYYF